MRISDGYKAANVELHGKYPGYGSKGHAWAERVIDLVRRHRWRTVLDYGCGKGSLRRALLMIEPGLEVREFDPAVPGKDAEPEPAELVVCTDVLEHVEPECLDEVVGHLVSLGTGGVLVAAACRPGKRQLADGRMDHLIVESPKWWRRRLALHGKFQEVAALRQREYAALLVVSP